MLVLGGCGADGEADDLSEARRFDEFRLYYAGPKVVGRPITSAGGGEDRDPQSGVWVFIYGDCELPEGEGGCAPFQIHNYDTCTRWAEVVAGTNSLRDFRGAKASFPGYNETVEIFTGRTTITISGFEPEVLKVALRQLRGVRQKKPSRLPPPAPGSLGGKLPCQDKPGR